MPLVFDCQILKGILNAYAYLMLKSTSFTLVADMECYASDLGGRGHVSKS